MITEALLDQLAARNRRDAQAIVLAQPKAEAAERIMTVLKLRGIRCEARAELLVGATQIALVVFATDEGLREALALEPSIGMHRHDGAKYSAAPWYDITLGSVSVACALQWVPA